MQVEGKVGIGESFGDGAATKFRLGKFGELLVAELGGRYAELTRRGKIFHSMTASVTIASALVGPLAAGTGQPILGLYNPLGSQRNLVVLKAGIITISGTPGGPMLWNYALQQTITATPNVTPNSGLLQGSVEAIAKGFSATALTGSTVCSALRHAFNISAVAAGFVDAPALEDLGGDITVPPGAFLGLAAFAAGSSHVVQASIVHAELPIS